MRLLIISLALAGMGCRIPVVISDPVISDPGATRSSRYEDCRQAARDYCREVEGAAGADLKRCVSRATYTCVAGSSQ